MPRPRPASGSPWADRLTSSISIAPHVRPSIGRHDLLGATQPSSRRLTVVLDPYVTAQFIGVISSTLNGEAVVKGRSLFRDRLGETVAAPTVTLVDDPTNPKAYTATDVDGEGLAGRRNVLIAGRCAAAVRPQLVLGASCGHRLDRQRDPRRLRRYARAWVAWHCRSCPGTRSQQELIADVDDGLLVQQMQGLHSGVNPISGDFSTGAAGLLIRTGPSVLRFGRSRSRRPCSGCCSTSSRSVATSSGSRCDRPA